MDKAYLARTPMIIRASKKEIDPFIPKEEGGGVGPECTY
jgi:hypothetical protein